MPTNRMFLFDDRGNPIEFQRGELPLRVQKMLTPLDRITGRITEPTPKFPGPKQPGIPPATPAPTAPAPSAPPTTNAEIDDEIKLFLNAIPIANPGDIITSEYHNSLRSVVLAMASRVGLNVSPTAEFKIFTFEPAFQTIVPATGAPPESWDVGFNRAAVPASQVTTARTVSGGRIVQLPDAASVFSMIVRGKKIGAAAPTGMTIALKRMKLDKSEIQNTLITIDLKSVEEGFYEKMEKVALSESERGSASAPINALTLAERQRVDNEEWLYFVTADWQGDQNAAKFEIKSIQIYCRV